MLFSFKLIILIVSVIFENVEPQRNEGDFCVNQSLVVNGVCTLISSCPVAMELLLKQKIFPQTCGFKNTTPIVCCPGSVPIIPVITPTVSSRGSAKQKSRTEEMQGSSFIATQMETRHDQDTSRLKDFCTVRSLGINGTCKLLTSCPSAIELLQQRRIFPQTCGFKNNHPMVCCAIESFPTTTITPTTAAKTILTFTTKGEQIAQAPPVISTQTEILQVGDKSRQKCHEYGQYVFSEAMIEVVPGRAPPPPIANCAVVSTENIVGGRLARPKEFPHMALLGYEVNSKIHWSCGGSLISENFVLSAAHCIFHAEYGPAKYILLGKLNLYTNTDDRNSQQIQIKRSIQHPDFVPSSLYNDIALIELERNAILNIYVRPACLNRNPNPTNELGIASGWGGSATLKKVILEMFSNRECNNTYRKNIGRSLQHGIVEETQICAGSRNEYRDTCEGDSGGPLQIINSKEVFCTYLILGITSFGRECGVNNIPGVYTRVSAYIKWIEDVVWA